MTKETRTVTTSGTGLMTTIGVVFVTLKLCGLIDWSWWWVTAPFWLPIACALMLILIGCAIMCVAQFLDKS